MHIHDLIGIGFGPSNIALAIALDELKEQGREMTPLFIEKQPDFAWHRNMLLDDTHMQISFLKDLATLRNPASRFTFLNYLHEKRRLQDFINLKTFFPSRLEFNDYLTWAAAQFNDQCVYGEAVVEVLPEMRDGEVELLRVRSSDDKGVTRERLARNLVVSVGGTPGVPALFRACRKDPRVFHSSAYLAEIARHPGARRIAVVGAGQSAAEIFLDLHRQPHRPQVDFIMRARSIKPSDDTPFVNEIFNADFIDYVFSRSDAERASLLDEFWHTNYAAPDLELIEQMFNVFYLQKVSGDERHRFLRRHQVEGVACSGAGVELKLQDLNAGTPESKTYDLVILATGYERNLHRALLEPLCPWLGDFSVDRNYRLHSTPELRPAIFLQGACEMTHGLSDTLLSVTATRSAEIAQVLQAALDDQTSQRPNRGTRHPETSADMMAQPSALSL